MVKQKSTDYKLYAVLYYINNDVSYTQVCKIFNCNRRSLKRWIQKYEENKSVDRETTKAISYKIRIVHLKFALKELAKNEQITMKELCKMLKKKFDDFDVTPQHLGKVIRDNNITRKRTRHEHFPNERRNKPVVKKEELKKFYDEIKKFSLGKIISIDETSIKPQMLKEYSLMFLYNSGNKNGTPILVL